MCRACSLPVGALWGRCRGCRAVALQQPPSVHPRPCRERLLRLGPFQLSLEQRVPAPLRLLGDSCRACSFAPRVFTDRSAGSRSFFPTARENRGLLSSALPCSR